MYEELLYYIWEHKHYSGALKGSDDEKIEIISPGERNNDSGPDFSNARIRIDETEWAGNIEIHNKASDWFRHGHQDDEAYDSTVLHIVYEDDARIERRDGSRIPQLCLKPFISTAMIYRYRMFMQARSWIACQGQIGNISPERIRLWLPALASERLQRKTQSIALIYENSGHDWETSFYILLAQSFGFKVNNLPFEMLARQLSLKQILKQQGNPFIVEALIFGMSGLLPDDANEKYPMKLLNEFAFQQQKLSLYPIDRNLWKTGRLRPGNFPTVRLAQFAAIMQDYESLFSKILKNTDRDSLHNMLRQPIHHYWENHYQFGKTAAKRIKILGESSADLLIINTISPFLFFYGKSRRKQELCEQALDLLSDIPAENNRIIRSYKLLGINAESAMESQALIELRKQYCVPKKCLQCRIGHLLLHAESKF